MALRVLTATDFSPAGGRAVRTAARWCSRESGALRIVHAIPPRRWLTGTFGDGRLRSTVASRAADALRQCIGSPEFAGAFEVSTGIVEGRASQVILREASAFRADLLVVGARGEGEIADVAGGLGATASKLVVATRQPLLLVRRRTGDEPAIVIVALDLESGSDAVLAWAVRAARGGRLHPLHVYDVPFAERLAVYGLAKSAVDVYTGEEQARREHRLSELLSQVALPDDVSLAPPKVLRGHATTQLEEHARVLDATCVVLGKHAAHSSRRSASQLGSVCAHAASHVRSDVLVVPSVAER